MQGAEVKGTPSLFEFTQGRCADVQLPTTGGCREPYARGSRVSGSDRSDMTNDNQTARFGLVLDCADPALLAEFWAGALGYINVGSAGAYVALYPPDRSGPKLLLQHVDEAKIVKNRMHLDIETPDIASEAVRLVGLGARRVTDTTCHEHGSTWILMTDPEGNEFCICDNGNPASPSTPNPSGI